MLQRLKITNVALIDNADIEFSDGLNVLSGETGAGKSVIIESLNFVLGAKADKSLIRSGTDFCSVTAEFDIPDNSAIFEVYDEFDFDRENLLIVSRKLTVDGKNSIKINGNTVTLSMLKKFTALLVDVHGQSEHFYLLKQSNQLKLIDKYAGAEVSEIKSEIKKQLDLYSDINKKLSALGGNEEERLVRIDVLTYQINEIKSADLKEGEEEELSELRQKIANGEKIITALNSVKEIFSGETGVTNFLSNAERSMSGITSFSDDYSELYDRISSLSAEADDISSTCENALENFDFDYDINYIEERLDLIKKLKRKYGENFEKINAYLAKIEEEKDFLENSNELSEKYNIEKSKIEKNIYNLYISLSEIRKKNAKIFSERVLNEIKGLGIENAKFEVSFADIPSIDNCSFGSENGIDNIEFKFSANAGEPLKTLSEVISGGEMSRFMLSIKAQTAKYNEVGTFIFDEIDAGLSGKTASVVAKKFAEISKNVQIIAISHLAQISAMADRNLLIVKNSVGNKTNTSVITLNENDKIDELVRLLGGLTENSSAKLLAKDMIEDAKKFKETI